MPSYKVEFMVEAPNGYLASTADGRNFVPVRTHHTAVKYGQVNEALAAIDSQKGLKWPGSLHLAAVVTETPDGPNRIERGQTITLVPETFVLTTANDEDWDCQCYEFGLNEECRHTRAAGQVVGRQRALRAEREAKDVVEAFICSAVRDLSPTTRKFVRGATRTVPPIFVYEELIKALGEEDPE